MSEYQILDFDAVTGFDGGADAKTRYKTADTQGIVAPCDDCPCSWVCAGSKREDGMPDWGKGLACSVWGF